ncbi:MAG: TrmH family RNA methyltransferase [Vicinamibacterales bacterium]
MTSPFQQRVHLSLDDPRLAHYRHIGDPTYLRAHHLFVAEGRLVVRRLLTSGSWRTESVLVTPTTYERLMSTLTGLSTPTPIYVVDQADMNGLVGFNIHRGCLALAVRPAERVLSRAVVERVSRVLMLEGVNNPDNVGGIFRSAAAFGVDVVVLGPNCGDPLYRKAVRTSMAATLAVPFVTSGASPDAIGLLRSSGFTIVALTPEPQAAPLPTLDRSPSRWALIVGAEGDGLTPAALDAADVRARIPTTEQVDSLNVTTAASIAMYHLFGDQ